MRNLKFKKLSDLFVWVLVPREGMSYGMIPDPAESVTNSGVTFRTKINIISSTFITQFVDRKYLLVSSITNMIRFQSTVYIFLPFLLTTSKSKNKCEISDMGMDVMCWFHSFKCVRGRRRPGRSHIVEILVWSFNFWHAYEPRAQGANHCDQFVYVTWPATDNWVYINYFL